MRRPWTRAEKRAVRDRYRAEGAARLAADLRRPLGGIYQLAAKLGLRRARPHFRWTVAAVELLARLVRTGHSDAEVADRMGADRHAVGAWRRALGLPSNAHGRRHRDGTRRATAAQLARAGVRSMGDLRVKAWGDAAEKYGLPRDLNPTAVKIVLALAAGPKTRREIVAALGRRWKAGNRGRNNLNCRKGGGSYLAWLDKLGLAVRVPRYVRAGHRGPTQQESVYRLTPAAVGRLRGAGVAVADQPAAADAPGPARGCSTAGCGGRYYARGLCKTCYHRPYSRAFYGRKKHDPAWLAARNARIAACKRRAKEQRALADLARIAAQLESKL